MARRRVERWHGWGVLVIVLVGGAIRLPFFTARSLWFDEAFSWRLIAYLPSGEFFTRAAADVHPVLYYLLLWLWVFPARLADPEFLLFWMRLFSVVLGAATVAAMIYAGRVLFRSRWAGLAAGLLTAVNAFQIQYAWEARMYTLGTVLAPFAMVALVRTMEARTGRAAWRAGLGFGVSLGALLHVHYFALFSWAALGFAKLLHVVGRWRQDARVVLRSPNVWAAEAGFWLSAALLLPWLPVFLDQVSRVQAAFWIPPLTLWAVPQTVARLFWGGIGAFSATGAIAATAASLALVLFSLVRGRTFGDLVAAASFVVPLVASIIVSLRTSVFLDRYFLFASLGLILLLARVLSFLPSHFIYVRTKVRLVGGERIRPRALALASFTLLGLVSVVTFWRQLDFRSHPGARAAARFVASEAAPGEPVVVSSPFVYFPLSFHLGCRPRGECPDGRVVRLYAEAGELLHFAGGPILTARDLVGPEALRQFGRARRLWAVDTTGFGGSRLSVPPLFTLEAEASFPELFPYQGDILVRAYAARPVP